MFYFEPFTNFIEAFQNLVNPYGIILPDQISPDPLFLSVVCGILGCIVFAFFLVKQFPVFSKLLWFFAMGIALLLEGVETTGTQIMWITFIGGVAGFYYLGSPSRPKQA